MIPAFWSLFLAGFLTLMCGAYFLWPFTLYGFLLMLPLVVFAFTPERTNK